MDKVLGHMYKLNKSKEIEKLEFDFNNIKIDESKKDINMDEIKYLKIDKEKPEFKDFDGFEYSKSDLTVDGLMNTETQLRRLKYLDEKYGAKPRPEIIATTRKVILLSLNKMDKPILFNTYKLKPQEKKKLQAIMHTYNDVSKEDIDAEFNEVCIEKLFNDDNDYSNTPIYNN